MIGRTALDHPRIGLISNPNSGHNQDRFEQIRHMVAGCGRVHHIVTGGTEDIPAALRQFADRQIDVLAISGGDGTVSAVLGSALEYTVFADMPPVVILPAGTANMTSGDIGAQGKLLPAVRRFCNWAQTGTGGDGMQIQRSLLRVQIGSESGAHYGMFLGLGAIIQGTEYAHQEIHSRGLRDDFSGALSIARTVWGLCREDPRFSQSIAINLRLDDARDGRDYTALIVAVSSLQRLFVGIQPFWGTEPGPLRLTLVTEHPYRFLRTFISIIRGKPNRHATAENGYISHNARRISIKMQGSMNLDGEILTSATADQAVTITASPAVTFIRL